MRLMFKYLLGMGIFLLAIIALVSFAQSAEARTATWDGGGADNLASNAINWDLDTAPIDGDTILINSGSKAVTWNLNGNYSGFTMATGYSGTVTQAASFSVTSFTLQAGTYTGSTSYILTDSGAWTKTGGTVTGGYVMNLKMTGTGVAYASNSGNLFYKFDCAGGVTANNGFTVGPVGGGYLIVSGSLTIANGQTITDYASGNAQITGTFAGPGTYYIQRPAVNLPSYALATISCPFIISTDGGAMSTSLTSAITSSSTLTVKSDNSYQCILNTAGHAVQFAGITIGAGGILNAGGSVITDTANWDSSLGGFTSGTSNVIFTGAGKTIKTGGGQSFCDLNISRTSTITLQSDIDYTRTGVFEGVVTFNGYTINGQQSFVPSSTSTFPLTTLQTLAIVLLGLLTYIGIKYPKFFIMTGFGWIAVSLWQIQPVDNTLSWLGLGMGLMFMVWGFYKFATD